MNICQSNHHLHNICNTDILWKQRTAEDYPKTEQFKKSELTWKQYYIFLNKNISSDGDSYFSNDSYKELINYGDIGLVKWIIEHGYNDDIDDLQDDYTIQYAVENSTFDMIQYIRSIYKGEYSSIIYNGYIPWDYDKIIKNPKLLDILKWAVSIGEFIGDTLYLNIMDTLTSQLTPPDYEKYITIFHWFNQLDIHSIEFVDDNESYFVNIIVNIVSADDLELFQLVWNNNIYGDKYPLQEYLEMDILEAIITNDAIKVFTYLTENIYSPTTDDANGAVAHNSIGILNILELKDILPDKDSIQLAITSDKIDIKLLEWLAQRNIFCTSDDIDLTFTINKFDVINWMIKCGIQPTSKAFTNAIQAHSPQSVKWLLSINMYPSIEDLKSAVLNEDIDILEVFANRKEKIFPTPHIIDIALSNESGSPKIAEWISKYGLTPSLTPNEIHTPTRNTYT